MDAGKRAFYTCLIPIMRPHVVFNFIANATGGHRATFCVVTGDEPVVRLSPTPRKHFNCTPTCVQVSLSIHGQHLYRNCLCISLHRWQDTAKLYFSVLRDEFDAARQDIGFFRAVFGHGLCVSDAPCDRPKAFFNRNARYNQLIPGFVMFAAFLQAKILATPLLLKLGAE